MRLLSVIGLILAGLVACRTAPVVQEGRLVDSWTGASDRDHIRTRGIGVPPEGVVGRTRRRAAARNAALVAARYEMMAVVRGIRIMGGLSIAQLIAKDSRIKEVADRIVEGAEEKSAEWMEDDACVVVLELERSKLRKMLSRERAMGQREGVGPSGPRAAALGLLMPGLGQIAVAGYVNDPGEASAVRTRGWLTMAMSLGWGAGAFVALAAPPKVSRDPATGRETRQSSEPLGFAALGLAALTQAWGVRDAVQVARQERLRITAGRNPHGASIVVSRRF